MTFIRTIPPEDATGVLGQLYDSDVKTGGAVANHTRALSLRPEAAAAWRAFATTIRAHLDPRRYELVTTIVAARLRCTY